MRSRFLMRLRGPTIEATAAAAYGRPVLSVFVLDRFGCCAIKSAVFFASKRSVGCLDAAIYSLSEHHTLIASLRIA